MLYFFALTQSGTADIIPVNKRRICGDGEMEGIAGAGDTDGTESGAKVKIK